MEKASWTEHGHEVQPHEDRYIAQLKSPDVQQEYVESVKKYLKEESKKREVRFVVLSTFMAYTAHCLSGGTLRQIKQICDDLEIKLIMDETLGALRMGPLCSFMHVAGFKPHGFVLGSKTFCCSSLWINPTFLKKGGMQEKPLLRFPSMGEVESDTLAAGLHSNLNRTFTSNTDVIRGR